MRDDGRALTDRAVDRIQTLLYRGIYDDLEVDKLFNTIRVQRKVLKVLFRMFKESPTRRESTADPIRNSTLAHLKELVAMEDPRKWRD